MVVFDGATGAGRTGNDVNGANGGRAVTRIFEIGAVSINPAISQVDPHGGGVPGIRSSVVAVDQIRTLPVMGVAGQHEVDIIGFENGQHLFPHCRLFVIGVGSQLGVGRMMERNDFPLLVGSRQVRFEPNQLRAAGLNARIIRVQDDKMYVAIVERVISFGSRRYAPCLSVAGGCENFVIRPGLGRAEGRFTIVVAKSRPYH